MSERKQLRVSKKNKEFLILSDGNKEYYLNRLDAPKKFFGMNQPVTAIVSESDNSLSHGIGKASDVEIDLGRVPHLGELQKGVFQYVPSEGQWAKVRTDPIDKLGGIEFVVKADKLDFPLESELVGERINFWLGYNPAKDELVVDTVDITQRQHTGLLVDSRGDYGFLSTHNQSRKVLLHKESCWPFDVEKERAKNQIIGALLAGQVYDFDISESEKGLKAVSARLSQSIPMKWIGKVKTHNFDGYDERVIWPVNSKNHIRYLYWNDLEEGTFVEYDLVPRDQLNSNPQNISPISVFGNLQGNIRHFNREKGFGFATVYSSGENENRVEYDLFFNVRDVYPMDLAEKIGNGTRVSAYSQHIISQEGKAQRAGILFLPDFLK